MNWQTGMQYARHLGYLWLAVGVAGLLFRTIQLFITRDLITGLAWMTKILTDPFNDARLYRGSPLRLLRGTLVEPALSQGHEDETADAHH
jgi:hypothetical protein